MIVQRADGHGGSFGDRGTIVVEIVGRNRRFDRELETGTTYRGACAIVNDRIDIVFVYIREREQHAVRI